MDLPVGSLVAPSPRLRAAMGTGEGAAVLLALRRGNGNLYYPTLDRCFWFPMRQVRPIPPDVVAEPSFERFLSELLFFLGAEECTIEEAGDGALSLAINVPALSGTTFDGVRERLGDRLRSYSVEPGSMRHLVLRVDLVGLPPAAGEGR